MGRKQKERRKKKSNQQLFAAATATAIATSTASSGETVGGNNSATAGRSSSVIDVDVGVDGGVAPAKKESTMETITITKCYHGSTAENFAKGSNFQMTLDEWLTALMKCGTNPTELGFVVSNFFEKHKNMMKDPEFGEHVFASATDIFLNRYGSEEYSSSKKKIKHVLNLGIELKYIHSALSPVREKCNKYFRDINTDRGIINVLDRETNKFCNCMKLYKDEAKNMEKMGACSTCRDEFPKFLLKRCSRCLVAQYCSKKCMKKSWPYHKQFCTQHNEPKSEE